MLSQDGDGKRGGVEAGQGVESVRSVGGRNLWTSVSGHRDRMGATRQGLSQAH